ncbi:MAG: hypothetical protein ABIL01_07260 [Pseudomonadota bacterium]
MAKSVKEILSEPAIAAQLRNTQQMSLLLADARDQGVDPYRPDRGQPATLSLQCVPMT